LTTQCRRRSTRAPDADRTGDRYRHGERDHGEDEAQLARGVTQIAPRNESGFMPIEARQLMVVPHDC